ncbi:carbonic anhydrase [Actinoallomurus spadix]|uniref:Carbonic anhydrase n=1 Tax=Actinoallomurus spadix TaxID=79912 RepID=A0ABN0XB54_9ACTN|nr:carbonic anhydrase [Actinoallomurus spadix]MCO5987778.1 carbonic anhydrase [Actinoallomurus spadix]
MQSLIDHARSFHQQVATHRGLRSPLRPDHTPQAIFVSCSDARVVPSLLTGSTPGDLFELRTAGNVIPPYRVGRLTAEAATLEYAVVVLGVRDLIVCGHTRCGAVRARTSGGALRHAPTTRFWLLHTHRWRGIRAQEQEDPGRPHLIAQLDKLRRYPWVARRLADGTLRLHGWFYDVETGAVWRYRPDTGAFVPL